MAMAGTWDRSGPGTVSQSCEKKRGRCHRGWYRIIRNVTWEQLPQAHAMGEERQ
jgi:hypothetical protein